MKGRRILNRAWGLPKASCQMLLHQQELAASGEPPRNFIGVEEEGCGQSPSSDFIPSENPEEDAKMNSKHRKPVWGVPNQVLTLEGRTV